MLKVVVVAVLAGSTAAFAPTQQHSRFSSVVSATSGSGSNFSKELGALPPLGFFDPLGFLKDGKQSTFDDLREKELKHGRVAMLAVVGYLTTAAGFRFTGAEDIPDGLASFPALLHSKDGVWVLVQMAGFFLAAEIANRDNDFIGGEAEFVGDYRNGALDFGWDKLSPETKMKKRAIELNNGRAAMMGIWGLVVHEQMGVSILPGGYLPGH